MISVICVYNSKEIAEKCLLKSLKNQTVEFEFIAIDNRKDEYKSVAAALNDGGKKAKGKYIMFVHQDVDLCSDTWLEESERILNSLSSLGIAGAAGVVKKRGIARDEIILSNSTHGTPPNDIGFCRIQQPEKVETLDESLIVIPKSVFEKLTFDEKVCDTYHLFGVDYSLTVKELGLHAYVLPLGIYHQSEGFTKTPLQMIVSLGVFPEAYYQTLGKLIAKHRNKYKMIYTTCGSWSTSCPMILQRIWSGVTGAIYCYTKRYM